jgi:hypothetical protein
MKIYKFLYVYPLLLIMFTFYGFGYQYGLYWFDDCLQQYF